MALTEEQNERLTAILQALEPEMAKLGQASQNFVQDQIRRHNQYDDRMFISPKQLAWLEDLYEKYAGGEKEVGDSRAPANEINDTPDPDWGDDEDPDAVPF